MRIQEYKEAKLKIFERCSAGLITESQRDELLTMLESKKGPDLTPESIKGLFDQLKDMYPDLEDKIDDLQEKIDKGGKKCGSGKKCGDSEESDDSEDGEGEVSEAAMELLDMIDAMF